MRRTVIRHRVNPIRRHVSSTGRDSAWPLGETLPMPPGSAAWSRLPRPRPEAALRPDAARDLMGSYDLRKVR
jgi:hypothetical protein